MKELNKLQTMDIKKLILVMSIPSIISMIVQALYNIVDSVFIANYSAKSLTALSIVFPIQLVIIAIFAGIGVSVNVFMARRLGEKNKDVAVNGLEHGLLIGLILWALISIAAFIIPQWFIKLFTDDAEIIKSGVQYLRIIMLFSFGSIICEICMNALRALGKPMKSMHIQIIGAVTNIILDPILIFGWFFFPEMGIVGAAVATVVGQIVSMFVAIFLLNRTIKIKITAFHYKSKIISDLLHVAIPVTLMTCLSSLMVAAVNYILVDYSEASIAVFGIYYKLQQFLLMAVVGLTQGIMPIMGYSFGAKDKKRLADSIKYSVIYSIVIMGIGTLIFCLFPNALLKMFDSSPEMFEIGSSCLRISSLSFIFMGVSMILATFFQSVGKPMVSLISSLGRQALLLIPIAIVGSILFGLNGIWIAFPITEFACAFLIVSVLLRTYHKIVD